MLEYYVNFLIYSTSFMLFDGLGVIPYKFMHYYIFLSTVRIQQFRLTMRNVEQGLNFLCCIHYAWRF